MSERSPLLASRGRPEARSMYDDEATISSNSTSDTDTVTTLTGWRLRLLLGGLWLSNFVFAFQSTAIPTISPTIGSSFNHAELASYLGSAFTLTNTAGIPLYGVLLGSLGRKFAMGTATFFFGFGSLACALSPSMGWLIAARAFAGLGGGGLLVVSAVICTDLVPLRDRGYWQGWVMTWFAIGAAIGGPVAGRFTDSKIGWQAAFLVVLPPLLLSAVTVFLLLPESPIAPTHKNLMSALASFDYLGSILLLCSMSTLLLGFSFHTSLLKPWSSPFVWSLLLASLVCSGAFVIVEARVENPIVPLSLFKTRTLISVYLCNVLLSIVVQSFLYHIPIYFAVVLKASAADTGTSLVSVSLAMGLGTLAAGQYIRSTGRYRLIGVIGLAVSILSIYRASMWNKQTPRWEYWIDVFPAGLGYSMYLCCALVAMISSVDAETMPKATALLYSMRSLGGTLGVSLGSSVQIQVLVNQLHKRFRDVPNSQDIISAVLHSKSAILALPSDQQDEAVKAYARSLKITFMLSAAVGVLTLIASLPMRQNEVHAKVEANADIENVTSPLLGPS